MLQTSDVSQTGSANRHLMGYTYSIHWRPPTVVINGVMPRTRRVSESVDDMSRPSMAVNNLHITRLWDTIHCHVSKVCEILTVVWVLYWVSPINLEVSTGFMWRSATPKGSAIPIFHFPLLFLFSFIVFYLISFLLLVSFIFSFISSSLFPLSSFLSFFSVYSSRLG